jgi:ABC-type bacteriocin/lantibiotic exporter with double-glycine peptidase domain
MNIGQFVASEIIILLVIDSAEKLILNLDNVFDTFTSLEKIGQVVDIEIDDEANNSSLNHDIKEPLSVEIDNLVFSHNNNNAVLKGISCKFDKNKNYCLTGSNGSGKSTLLHLITGLYTAQQGSICINGFPIANYNLAKLYKSIGNGFNEETIFEGTLYENITLGRDYIQNDDVKWAVNQIFLNDYIKSLPKGLDNKIDISGNKLSKSIIQRIILARSIVNYPRLLLIENEIDCIEDEIRNKIIDFLTDKKNGWTLIFISNDRYLQNKCDHVFHLENGKLINS